MVRFYTWKDLPAKGVKYSKPHIHRLIKKKKFPAPVKGLGPEDVWTEEQIDRYVADRIADAARTDEAV